MLTNRLRAICTIALLGGCTATSEPGPAPAPDLGLGDSPTIGGQIQNWASSHFQTEPVSVSVGSIRTSGLVDTNGYFSVTLPGADKLANAVGPPALSMDSPG